MVVNYDREPEQTKGTTLAVNLPVSIILDTGHL